MRRLFVLAAIAACVPLSAGHAEDQAAPPAPETAPAAEASVDPMIAGMAGPFILEQGSGGPQCRVALSTEAAIHAFAIDIPETCHSDFPELVEVAGWTILEDGTLRLTDALGKGLYEFTEIESGLFLMSGPPGFSMVNVDEGDFTETQPIEIFPEQRAGAYVLSQVEAPELARCELTLLPEPGGEDWYNAAVDVACPQELTRFEIIGWRPLANGVALIGKPGEIGTLTDSDQGPLEGKIEPNLTLRLVRI